MKPDLESILEDFYVGLSPNDIARKYGHSPHTVTAILRREGRLPQRIVSENVVRAIQASTWGLSVMQAAKYSGASKSVVSYIGLELGLKWRQPSNVSPLEMELYATRYEPQQTRRRATPIVVRAIQAHALGFTQTMASRFANTTPTNISKIWKQLGLKPHYSVALPRLEYAEITKRYNFLKGRGLLKSIAERNTHGSFASVEIMEKSLDFFYALGLQEPRASKRRRVVKTLRDYPSLLFHNTETNLLPKLRFLMFTVGIPNHKIAERPELFTYSLKSMVGKYFHYADRFGDHRLAASMFRAKPCLFGYAIPTLDAKMDELDELSISYHGRYILLTQRLSKVIEQFDINERGTS